MINFVNKMFKGSKPMTGKELEILNKTASRLISDTPTTLCNPIYKNINTFISNPNNNKFKESIDYFKSFFEKNFNSIQNDKPLSISIIEDDCLLIEWIYISTVCANWASSPGLSVFTMQIQFCRSMYSRHRSVPMAGQLSCSKLAASLADRHN